MKEQHRRTLSKIIFARELGSLTTGRRNIEYHVELERVVHLLSVITIHVERFRKEDVVYIYGMGKYKYG